MNRPVVRGCLLALFGAILGYMSSLVLTAVSAPQFRQNLHTKAEIASFESIDRHFGWFSKLSGSPVFFVVALVLTVILLLIIIHSINAAVFDHVKKGRAKFASIKAAVILATAVFAVYLSKMFLFEGNSVVTLRNCLGTAACGGVLFLLLGEAGWAGDFTSWKTGTSEQAGRPAMAFACGAAAGIMQLLVLGFLSWAFGKYFLLVSEVWDRSGETSFLGHQYLAYGLMVQVALWLPLSTGINAVMSPSYKTIRERLYDAIAPGIFLGILLAAVAWIYGDGSVKYDLNKTFTAAVGIQRDTHGPATLIVLGGTGEDKPIVQTWQPEVSATGFDGLVTVPATAENISRIRTYLAARVNGSVHQYMARNILSKAYHARFNLTDGMAQQFDNSHELILERMLLLKRLQWLPVTETNIGYLKKMSDASQWFVGARAAAQIARAYRHFGMPAESSAWLEKANATGSAEKVTLPDGDIVVDGAVSGRLYVNGAVPAGAIVALIIIEKDTDTITAGQLESKLVAVSSVSSNGAFQIDRLGADRYCLAFLIDGGLKSGDNPVRLPKILGAPRTIAVSRAVRRLNLGTIDVRTD